MFKLLTGVAVLALLAGSPALAQQTANSGSTSGAQSGSVSGAVNDNSTTNGAQTTTVAPVNNGNGDSTARANSGSTANSGSSSTSQGGSSDSRSTSTGGTSNAQNGAATAGNAQSITFNSVTPTHTEAVVKSVPNVYSAALTTTLTETCMGSSSAGGAGMGFGFSLGSTWEDKQCVRRLNARELAQTLGERDAARALLCQDKDVKKAFETIGKDCMAIPVAAAAPPPPPVPYAQPVPDDSHPMAPIPNPAPSGERGSLSSKDHRG